MITRDGYLPDTGHAERGLVTIAETAIGVVAYDAPLYGDRISITIADCWWNPMYVGTFEDGFRPHDDVCDCREGRDATCMDWLLERSIADRVGLAIDDDDFDPYRFTTTVATETYEDCH